MGKHLLSLFTGAGGLDLGLEAAGFELVGAVENDPFARRTIAANHPEWNLLNPGDIFSYTPQDVLKATGLKRGALHLLAAGPPCQPFSKASHWVSGDTPRLEDPRAQTLQAFLDVVEAGLPEVLLLENVAGLAYTSKAEGLDLLRNGLELINRKHGTKYRPDVFQLNAAAYGVPQFRLRTFLVAQRAGNTFAAPAATHGTTPDLSRYLTTWDAIGEFSELDRDEELSLSGKWASLLPSIPEGYNYLWHTPKSGGLPLFGWRTRYWTFLLKLAKNRPAWTISAHPGPATGPFHWLNRRLSITEMLRLQSFSANYAIDGGLSQAQKQIGNAVPPLLGETLGRELMRQHFGRACYGQIKYAMTPREDCPELGEAESVPLQYLSLVGNHSAHPGSGLGPGALRRAITAPSPNEEETHAKSA